MQPRGRKAKDGVGFCCDLPPSRLRLIGMVTAARRPPTFWLSVTLTAVPVRSSVDRHLPRVSRNPLRSGRPDAFSVACLPSN